MVVVAVVAVMVEVVVVEGVISGANPSLCRVVEMSKCVLCRKEVVEKKSQTIRRKRRMEIPLCEGSVALVFWTNNLSES